MKDADRSVAIIGLGLMGGSLARDLSMLGWRVVAGDARSDVTDAALAEGVVHSLLDASLANIADVDLVVIATPVDASGDVLSIIAALPASGFVVTDVGSTKARIVARAEEMGVGDRFVGSHPLAGDHRAGWSAARAGLYRDATVYLCHTSDSSEHAIESVRSLWSSVGARWIEVDAPGHDRRMTWVSHLPQIASSALALALREAGFGPGELGPGGRDVARLAGSSPEMWKPIARANAGRLADAADALGRQLERLAVALREDESAAIDDFFRSAHDWADRRPPADPPV